MNAQRVNGTQPQDRLRPAGTIQPAGGTAAGPNPLFADRRPDTAGQYIPDQQYVPDQQHVATRQYVADGQSGTGSSAARIVAQPGSQVIVLSPSGITTHAEPSPGEPSPGEPSPGEPPAARRRPRLVARLGGPFFLIGLLVTGLAAGGGMAVALLGPQGLGDRTDRDGRDEATINLSGAPVAVPPTAVVPDPMTTEAGMPNGPGRCTAELTLEEWPGGFVGRVAVHAQMAIQSWTVTLDLPPGVTITEMWNGERAGDTGVVQVRNAGYNAPLERGASTDFGWKATGSAAGLRLGCAAEQGRSPEQGPPPEQAQVAPPAG